jgi:hypothetical protein
MTNLQDKILEDFEEVQTLRGYKRPNNLTDIERTPPDDDVYDIPESRCRVDLFIKKNRGWR